ncbi:TonB-dependent receptor [Acidithiobacillus sp.]
MKHIVTPRAIVKAILAATFIGPVPALADDPVKTDDISVFGQKETRQVLTMTRSELSEAPPGYSPLASLQKLPGVFFSSSDPLGNYEWGSRFSIRGFNQNQLGFTLDGLPLGDQSYGNNNGLSIGRAISQENISRVSVSEGASDTGTASTSNLGGSVQFFSVDPKNRFGVTLAETYGSANSSRTFLRLDTGDMGAHTKAFVSLLYSRADKWKGYGPQTEKQLNAKIVHFFGESKITAFVDISRRNETDYADLSLDSQRRLGWNWDNYAPDFQRAVNAANGIFTGGVTSVDDAYYLARGLRNDELAYVNANLKLSDLVRLDTTVYYHHNDGQGHWYTPYVASPSGLPISIRTTEYAIRRGGVISSLVAQLDNHQLSAGFWYEYNKHQLARNYYNITSGDINAYDRFLSNPFATAFLQQFNTTTWQFFAQDQATFFNDRLKVTLGVKSPHVNMDASSLVGNRAAGSISAQRGLLPQVGLNYQLTPSENVFFSYAQNMRAFQPGISGPFSTTQAAFNASSGSLKPETSQTLDIGIKTQRGNFQASLDAYLVNFDNRLLSISQCAGILGCPSTLANVGSVHTRGVEGAFQWSPIQDVTWYNSLTYTSSKYQSDYLDGTTLVRAAGKNVVDAPRLMFATQLAYEHAGFFGRLGAKYAGERYYTYTNDAKVPGYWLTDLSTGYSLHRVLGLKELRFQLNITNLLNENYWATIGTNGFVSSDPQGQFWTLQNGAPRQVFGTVSGTF